jgi:hypothetical protein
MSAGNESGYVDTVSMNLLPTVSVEDFQDDLKSGSGNELGSKFRAVYSSSALAVNFFGFFKKNLDQFSLLNESGFTRAQFEKKLYTGLGGTPPNLDFYLESTNSIIGIESKFLEPLSPKRPSFSNSYSELFLEKLDSGLPSLVRHYRETTTSTSLDTSQLIKHSMGLLNNKGSRSAKLVYVYWEPLNADQIPVYQKHQRELEDFSERMKDLSGLSFHSYSYNDLYNMYRSNVLFAQHLENFNERYFIAA